MEIRTRPLWILSGWGTALLKSAWFGSMVGMTLMLIVTAFLEGPPVEDLWAVPIIIVGYGTVFGFPLALLGLLLFGFPMATVLRRWAYEQWMPFLAILCGALAGRVLYHLVDHAIGFGIDDLWRFRLADYGVLIGAPTGLIWLFRARRVLRDQRIEDAPPEALSS